MSEIAMFAGVVVWLFLGGLSFAYYAERFDIKGYAVGLLALCLAIAPFMAGTAWLHSRNDKAGEAE